MRISVSFRKKSGRSLSNSACQGGCPSGRGYGSIGTGLTRDAGDEFPFVSPKIFAEKIMPVFALLLERQASGEFLCSLGLDTL